MATLIRDDHSPPVPDPVEVEIAKLFWKYNIYASAAQRMRDMLATKLVNDRHFGRVASESSHSDNPQDTSVTLVEWYEDILSRSHDCMYKMRSAMRSI